MYNNQYLILIIPIKKENWKGKDKQEKQKKSSATAISFDSLW